MALTIDLLRPDDLLVLRIEATNLKLDASKPDQPVLVREAAASPAFLTFFFQPQALAEQAYFETAAVSAPGGTPPPSNPPLPGPPPDPAQPDPPQPPGSTLHRLGDGSRLVFRVPAAVASLPYSMAGLLDWSRLELMLPPAAEVPPGASNAPKAAAPPIAEPGPLESAIDFPYRLTLAPNVGAGGTERPAWVHATEPVVHAGRAELWHTRLGQLRTVKGRPEVVEASQEAPLPVRAVWSPDFVTDGPLPTHSTDDVPFRMSMSPRDRGQIVILTSGFNGYTLTVDQGATAVSETYVPVPVAAARLFLSAFGAWLSSRGAWPFPVSYQYLPFLRLLEAPAGGAGDLAPPASFVPPPPVAVTIAPPKVNLFATELLDLIEWDHQATQGRDHYVRIVYEGFLFPFGHRASLIKVTERKVLAPNGPAGNPVGSPVAYLRQKMYVVVKEKEIAYDTTKFAHQGREMPLASLVRIVTAVTPEIDIPQYQGNTFWINVGGEPFPFHVTGLDPAGKTVSFHAPLMFVSIAENQVDNVPGYYSADNERRRSVVRGQNVAYADPAIGDTVLKTSSLFFNAVVTQHAGPYVRAPFLPFLDRAAVTIPALTELTGTQTAVLIQLFDPYLQSGPDPHAGVFAQVVGTPPAIEFSADKAGGLSRPNLNLSALSGRKGLVSGDPNHAAAGQMDPAQYFGNIDAKLFGTFDLGQLIPIDQLTKLASAQVNAPEIRTHAVPDRRHPVQLITNITWEPQLQNFTAANSEIDFDAGSTFKLHVHIERNLDGTPPASDATGHLTNFRVIIAGVIQLKIASIRFESVNGSKSMVTLDLASSQAITFVGALSFIQTLADILPPGLFGGSGPSITLGPAALRVTYTIGLPPITCGVFSLEHIAIMAGLDLPYLDGKPTVEFGFASRGRPFLVTVEIFGGGGFVHVVLDADGMRMVEGAIEFGANFSMDIGIASGSVHAMAGIYFQLKNDPPPAGVSTTLTGFVDIGGMVSVLGGIISISIDLNISLTWQHSNAGNVITGKATLSISVHIIFFSISVSVSVERSFGAGGGDPKVHQLVTPPQWAEYAAAFA